METDKTKERFELIVVYEAIGQLEAETVQARLEAAGIPAVVQYIQVAPPYVPLGGVRVAVARERAAEARAILDKKKSHRKAKSHG